MTYSAYDITIPVMLRGLRTFEHYLDEATKLASSQISLTEIVGARLAPDMLSFGEQVDVGCRKAQRHAASLCNRELPQFIPIEPSLDTLRARLDETKTFLEQLPLSALNAAEIRTYYLSEPLFHGWLCPSEYILHLVLPDFFFHLATAHAILRHLGAPIGKRDYLGSLEVQSGGYS
jgi:uncharacterized protein